MLIDAVVAVPFNDLETPVSLERHRWHILPCCGDL
jgi:hypothetical protein